MGKHLKIVRGNPLSGRVELPGDKSLSHRTILMSALADGTSRIRNCLIAGVTRSMMQCLTDLGVKMNVFNADACSAVEIEGVGLHGLEQSDSPLNCNGSATTMRLLAGVLSGQSFASTLDGSPQLRQRPMTRLIEPLSHKGAWVESTGGRAPLNFAPSRLRPSDHVLSVASAQVKSSILLAGLYTDGPTTVREPHRSRDHTERLFEFLGLPIHHGGEGSEGHTVSLAHGVEKLQPLDAALPSDPSSAAFLMVATLLIPGSGVEFPRICLNPGRTGLFDTLKQMGADVKIRGQGGEMGEPVGTIRVTNSRLEGTTISGSTVARMIDEFPVLAVAATQAQGITRVRDAIELRYKESNRIETLAQELNKMGAGIEPTEDGFVVRGPVRLTGAVVNGRGDHRLAMSLAVAGLVADGETIVEGWEVIRESFPSFLHIMKQLGANIAW
ncbi:MAG: 3-phosphoshikimate 1-carboxyvinyltransferase [Thermodesulfobacteriota bacterium]|nr:3-phosphoshikimate 1-carboxyvinyltransferase [Thermodesulfobacteriota bacterium]